MLHKFQTQAYIIYSLQSQRKHFRNKSLTFTAVSAKCSIWSQESLVTPSAVRKQSFDYLRLTPNKQQRKRSNTNLAVRSNKVIIIMYSIRRSYTLKKKKIKIQILHQCDMMLRQSYFHRITDSHWNFKINESRKNFITKITRHSTIVRSSSIKNNHKIRQWN